MHKPTHTTYSSLIIIAAATVLLSLGGAYFVSKAVNDDTKHEPTMTMHESMNHGKLIVHISAGPDEPHAQMMGLQKALKAKEAGSAVFLFMDVKATNLALQTTDVTFADFPSSQKLIRSLIDKGVEVYVCPHCLMINGNTMNDVQDGIKELSMDAMMKFSSGGAVTTLDY